MLRAAQRPSYRLSLLTIPPILPLTLRSNSTGRSLSTSSSSSSSCSLLPLAISSSLHHQRAAAVASPRGLSPIWITSLTPIQKSASSMEHHRHFSMLRRLLRKDNNTNALLSPMPPPPSSSSSSLLANISWFDRILLTVVIVAVIYVWGKSDDDDAMRRAASDDEKKKNLQHLYEAEKNTSFEKFMNDMQTGDKLSLATLPPVASETPADFATHRYPLIHLTHPTISCHYHASFTLSFYHSGCVSVGLPSTQEKAGATIEASIEFVPLHRSSKSLILPFFSSLRLYHRIIIKSINDIALPIDGDAVATIRCSISASSRAAQLSELCSLLHSPKEGVFCKL
jgi:hypothetical protein